MHTCSRPTVIATLLSTLIIADAGLAQQPPIIDMHMHAREKAQGTPDGKPSPLPCTPQPCAARPARPIPEGSVLQGTLAAMKQHNVVLGFLSDVHTDVDQWIKVAPGKFLPSPLMPQRFEDASLPSIDSLRRDYRSGRFKGMGEIGTQYFDIAPNDQKLEPYFALAEELDLPVLIHSGALGAPVPQFRPAYGRPLLLEPVIVRHPKLRIYIENAGYPYLDESVALMTQYLNVHADLSTISWIIPRSAFHRYLQALMDAGLGKRLMFGSDQMEWPETIGMAIEAIESADFLTAEQKRDIFYNNAARFLELSEQEIAKHHGR